MASSSSATPKEQLTVILIVAVAVVELDDAVAELGGQGLGAFGAGLGSEDDELVAADAGEHLLGPHQLAGQARRPASGRSRRRGGRRCR